MAGKGVLKHGEPVTLTAVVRGLTPPLTYAWQLGDGSIAATETVTHHYAQAGDYGIRVRVTDAAGKHMGWMKMPTEINSDEEPFSLLWGLITFGGGKIVTHASGFVHGSEFWPTVRMVAGFVFGIKAVSTGSRLF